MVRFEMPTLSLMWDDKPGGARWWERVKTRPSYESAIANWLRPEDLAPYEKTATPWPSFSKNLPA
jgi:hypothetical protein